MRLEDTRHWRNMGIAKTLVSALDLLVLLIGSVSFGPGKSLHLGSLHPGPGRSLHLGSLSPIKTYCWESEVATWTLITWTNAHIASFCFTFKLPYQLTSLLHIVCRGHLGARSRGKWGTHLSTDLKRVPKSSAIEVSDILMQHFKNQIDKPRLTGQLPIIVNKVLLEPEPGFGQGEWGRIMQVQPQILSAVIFLLFVIFGFFFALIWIFDNYSIF